jgi:hypothetical protein
VTGVQTCALPIYSPTGEPLDGILVEVFDNPEALLEVGADLMSLERKQKRVAACKTGNDGRFSFDFIPPGKYEVRYSAQGFETKPVFITLKPFSKRASRKKLKVMMRVAG